MGVQRKNKKNVEEEKSDKEQEEEVINVRDSFSIDYNPDYYKELLQQQQEGSQSVTNLTKKALSKLVKINSKDSIKKKRRPTNTNKTGDSAS